MRRLVPVLLAIGCNHDVERDAVSGPAQAGVQLASIPSTRGAPHAGSIREVSVTDEGDAAVTIDDAGTVRLWPALDGSREPIPVVAPAATRVSIARDGDGWLVALLDDAGSAHLLRFARGGSLTAKTEVAGDVRVEQLVASRGNVLVRRADQSIELVDASGARRGRIVAEPGERIAAIAMRGDVALAVIADVDDTAKTVRWIAHDHGLAWGARVTLPVAVIASSVAVAASGKRVAAADATSHQLRVFELGGDRGATPAVVPGTNVEVQAGEPLGFVDDAHVAVMGTQPRWWVAASAPHADPWANTTPANPATSIGAVGGGTLVSGYVGGLALATPTHTSYLGWNDIGVQSATFAGDEIAVTFGPTRVAWLDASLVEKRRRELPNVAYAQPVGEHHVVIDSQLAGEQRLELVDLEHADQPVLLGSFKNLARFDDEPHAHVFGVGEGTAEHLWALDLAHTTVTRLPDLTVRTDAVYVRLLDPAVADGARALVAVNAPDRTEVTLLPGGKVKSLPGYMLVSDDRGRAYSRDGAGTLYREGVAIGHAITDTPAPDHAGALVALFGPGGVRLIDAHGERWKLPIWGVNAATFSDDDTRLLVRTTSGMVMLDVATGKRLATACAWGFGLSATPISTNPVGQGSVCEDGE